jgi:hypothetical protein
MDNQTIPAIFPVVLWCRWGSWATQMTTPINQSHSEVWIFGMNVQQKIFEFENVNSAVLVFQ